MLRCICITILMGFFLSSLPAPAAEESHPFSVHDLVGLDRISDPNLSPDESRLAFVLRKTDMAADRGRTDLYVMNTDGTGLKPLTTHPDSDFSPRWAPDGKSILFISTRSGSSQVWRIPVDGGEAVQVTSAPLNVGNLVVSPGGSKIAFTLSVFTDCASPEATKKRLDEIAARKVTGRVYDRLFIRHWDHWKDGRRSHLFVMHLEEGRMKDVMKGMDADTPSQPFGGPEEITFTPDGKHVVFTARDAGRKEAWSTNFDLYMAPADGSAPPRNLTAKNKAWDTQPSFSPDGKTLAYLAMSRPGYESDRYRIVLKSWPAGGERVLADAWDHSPRSIGWSPDSKTLYTAAAHLGQVALFSIDIESGAVRTVVGKGHVGSVVPAGGKIYFGMDHLRSPVELYSVLPDGNRMKALTSINGKKLAQVRMGEPEQFAFKGWNGETVYGYVVKPVDFDSSNKYPVSFLVHGGPQGSFGNFFHYRWNAQTYTGAGYGVVMVDFHGSTGYGQAFTDSIRGDWGGKPLEDLQKGLEAALERYPWLDGDRVGALGASFGGFMINWIAGNWSDRFRCLVNHDGNLDERLAYYDTEELWFPEWDHVGTPWDNPEGYEKHNPINYVHNWKTPMLVVHGALDFRVVETQGISTFTALQRRGIPSKLLYFPDENHWVLKPHNSILWHETVIGWLDQWLK